MSEETWTSQDKRVGTAIVELDERGEDGWTDTELAEHMGMDVELVRKAVQALKRARLITCRENPVFSGESSFDEIRVTSPGRHAVEQWSAQR